MNKKIEKILNYHKNNELTTIKAINEILKLSIVNKNKVEICPICNENILINDICPSCTIQFCTPPENKITF